MNEEKPTLTRVGFFDSLELESSGGTLPKLEEAMTRSRAVGHTRKVWPGRRWLMPGDAGAIGYAAFIGSGGKLEIELVAKAILSGCQALCRYSWHWFTETRLRYWFQAAKLPWQWLSYAFECRMIVPVVRKRQPHKRFFAVTKRFVLYWLRHLQGW